MPARTPRKATGTATKTVAAKPLTAREKLAAARERKAANPAPATPARKPRATATTAPEVKATATPAPKTKPAAPKAATKPRAPKSEVETIARCTAIGSHADLGTEKIRCANVVTLTNHEHYGWNKANTQMLMWK